VARRVERYELSTVSVNFCPVCARSKRVFRTKICNYSNGEYSASPAISGVLQHRSEAGCCRRATLSHLVVCNIAASIGLYPAIDPTRQINCLISSAFRPHCARQEGKRTRASGSIAYCNSCREFRLRGDTRLSRRSSASAAACRILVCRHRDGPFDARLRR